MIYLPTWTSAPAAVCFWVGHCLQSLEMLCHDCKQRPDTSTLPLQAVRNHLAISRQRKVFWVGHGLQSLEMLRHDCKQRPDISTLPLRAMRNHLAISRQQEVPRSHAHQWPVMVPTHILKERETLAQKWQQMLYIGSLHPIWILFIVIGKHNYS